MRLPGVIERLEAFYGAPNPPEVSNPWEMILWENIAYLADDATRAAAMAILRETIGVTPEEILGARREQLMAVAEHGIVAENTIDKILRAAEIALREFDGDLKPVLSRPTAQARKALKKFPAIGDPGADKILLFGRALSVLALESNGLRVLVRLGFGEEKPNYATTYRLVQEAIEGEIVRDFSWLIKAHQLLRRHGQELCKRTRPRCGECPLARECPWALANAAGGNKSA
jgi:endonuclease III